MTQEGITLGIAVLGLGLSCFNTWHQFSRTRVNLKITAETYLDRNGTGLLPHLARPEIIIRVTNLSEFIVNIEKIELIFHDGSTHPLKVPSGKLESRTNVETSYSPYSEGFVGDRDRSYDIKEIYVKTACGQTIKAKPKAALNKLKQEVQEQERKRGGSKQ